MLQVHQIDNEILKVGSRYNTKNITQKGANKINKHLAFLKDLKLAVEVIRPESIQKQIDDLTLKINAL